MSAINGIFREVISRQILYTRPASQEERGKLILLQLPLLKMSVAGRLERDHIKIHLDNTSQQEERQS